MKNSALALFVFTLCLSSSLCRELSAGEETVSSEHLVVYFDQESFLQDLGFFKSNLPAPFNRLSSYMTKFEDIEVATENQEKVRRYAIKVVQWYVAYWPELRNQIGENPDLKFEFANTTKHVFGVCANMLNRANEPELALKLNEIILAIDKNTSEYLPDLIHTVISTTRSRDPYFTIEFALDAVDLIEQNALPTPGFREDYKHIYEILAERFQAAGDPSSAEAMMANMRQLEARAYLDEESTEMDPGTFRTIITDNFYNELLIPYLEDPELKNNLTFE